MSDQINDGGCAFPFTEQAPGGEASSSDTGMSLRDYFAAQALIGEVSSQSYEDGWINTGDARRDAAVKCYAIADAMLEARK